MRLTRKIMSFRVLQVLKVSVSQFTFFTILFSLTGCGVPQSVNPFYQPQDVVFDPSILGEWQGADPADKGNLVVIKAHGADAYLAELTGYDEDKQAEVCWTLEAHQFDYQQTQYVDFFPIAFRVNGEKQDFQTKANEMWFLIPVHTVMRLHHDKQKLSLHWSGGSEPIYLFKKEDEVAKQKRLAVEKRQRDILTMTTEQLQQQVLGQHFEGGTETNVDLVRKK
jgi:hypothetical protein